MFIHSLVDGFWGVSTFDYYDNTAMNICVQVFGGGMISILLGIDIGIYTYTYIYLQLLGDMIALFITLLGTAKLFSKVIIPFNIPTTNLWES